MWPWRSGTYTGPRTPMPAWRRWNAFEAGPWGEKYPAIAQSWRRNWEARLALLGPC